MKFSVIPSARFKKEAKRLIKKYPSLIGELADLGTTLERTPTAGTDLGGDMFKIRLSIKSKGKGKSGGARIITYLVNENTEVYLLTIYDKTDFESIDGRTLRQIVAALETKR